MENKWPETVDELLDECQRLISKYDLYTLGKYGEPFTGEKEPRVDGTEYLAGEYQYGVAMVPARWVTHVIKATTLGGGKLTAEQVREVVEKHWHDLTAGYDMPAATALPEYSYDWQAIADELNTVIGGGECTPHGEWKRVSQTQEVRHVFCDCGYELGMDERDSFPFQRTRLFAMPNYCKECGRRIRKAVKR